MMDKEEMLKKLLNKKKDTKREMSPHEKEAKLSVLDSMKSLAEDEMKKRLGGMKKVSVTSDTKEGLEKGLDKAKSILDQEKLMSEESKDPTEEASEDTEAMAHMRSEDSEEEPMTEEEIDSKMRELQAMKDLLKSKRS